MVEMVLLEAGHQAPWGKPANITSEVPARKFESIFKFQKNTDVTKRQEALQSAILKSVAEDEGGDSHKYLLRHAPSYPGLFSNQRKAITLPRFSLTAKAANKQFQ